MTPGVDDQDIERDLVHLSESFEITASAADTTATGQRLAVFAQYWAFARQLGQIAAAPETDAATRHHVRDLAVRMRDLALSYTVDRVKKTGQDTVDARIVDQQIAVIGDTLIRLFSTVDGTTNLLRDIREGGVGLGIRMAQEGRALSAQAELARLRADVESATKSANDAQEEVQEKLTNIRRASGEVGTASLSGFFETYGQTQTGLSNGFRFLTITALSIVALLGAAFLLPGSPLADNAAVDTWHPVVYRVAILAALGSLGAYFARQAGVHRRMGEWAESIAVQLKSFGAFTDVIDPDRRAEVQVAFARRVLGNPPDVVKGGGTDADTQLLQAVVDNFLRNARPEK